MKAFHQLQVIIYDCDGVLIDSRAANQAFYNHILDHFGLPPLTREQWHRIAPLTAAEALVYLFEGRSELAAAQALQKNIDNSAFIPLIRLQPHLKATLVQLRRHYRLAIATNRGKSLAMILQHFGLGDFFDLTVSSLDVQNPKPDPEGLAKILRHFQVPPDRACYIGDAWLDQEVADRAGVIFGAYQNPSLAAAFHLDSHGDLWRFLPSAPD
ncbi:MAG: HAD family hydrolase [Desulfobacteraceae bacterium]